MRLLYKNRHKTRAVKPPDVEDLRQN